MIVLNVCVFTTEEPSFFLLTVKHVKRVLQEQEKTVSFHKWVMEEATNIQRLQEAGTFLNALTQKFDKIVIPIFAKIIFFADRNSNLELLIHGEPYIIKLWLQIYSSPHLCQPLFHNTRSTLQERSESAFESKFPFSWLFFQFIKELQSTNSGMFI